MDIKEIDVYSQDIMWFAVDKNGNIGLFTSGVNGNVPSFVCKSKENLEKLEEFFVNQLNNYTDVVIKAEDLAFDECIEIAQKGLYYFDAYNGNEHTENYMKIIEPNKNIKLNDLTDEIKNILIDCVISNVDFVKDSIIDVDNAY